MKPLLIVLILAISNCSTSTVRTNESSLSWDSASVSESKAINIDFPKIRLSISDTDPDAYRTTVNGNIASILSRGYEGIDGRTIVITLSDLDRISARVRFEFGVLQYLTDDRPADDLDFSDETGWNPIDVSDKQIRIPQFYINREDVIDVYKLLGFTNQEKFISTFEAEHFGRIRSMSYRTQREYYEGLLRERARYEQCCPEYIDQAKRFLNKGPTGFRTFNKLGVEIFLKSLTVEVSGTDNQGKQNIYTVIWMSPHTS